MNFIISFIFLGLIISLIGLTASFFYYFLFSVNSPLKKRKIEKKLNSLLSESEEYQILPFKGYLVFIDKKNKKSYII